MLSIASFFGAIDLILLEVLHNEDGVVLLCTGDQDITKRFSTQQGHGKPTTNSSPLQAGSRGCFQVGRLSAPYPCASPSFSFLEVSFMRRRSSTLAAQVFMVSFERCPSRVQPCHLRPQVHEPILNQ